MVPFSAYSLAPQTTCCRSGARDATRHRYASSPDSRSASRRVEVASCDDDQSPGSRRGAIEKAVCVSSIRRRNHHTYLISRSRESGRLVAARRHNLKIHSSSTLIMPLRLSSPAPGDVATLAIGFEKQINAGTRTSEPAIAEPRRKCGLVPFSARSPDRPVHSYGSVLGCEDGGELLERSLLAP